MDQWALNLVLLKVGCLQKASVTGLLQQKLWANSLSLSLSLCMWVGVLRKTAAAVAFALRAII